MGHVESPLHERLATVVGDKTYRAISADTGHNAETIRRYLQGQAPSADFLSSVCEVYDVNAHWLMTGRGPRRQSDATAHVLRRATPSDLLSAVAETLEKLVERVDRLEVYAQSLETRLRASRSGVGSGEGSGAASERSADIGIRVSPGGRDDSRSRADRIADAVAERPSEDVD